MTHLRFLFLLLVTCYGQLKAQSFKEHYTECVKALHGSGIGDTAYLRLIRQVYGCMQGAYAPNFSIKTLEGKTFSLSKLKGQVIVINFWSSKCMPCIAEMPALNEIVTRYKGQDVTFISATYESKEKTREFLKNHVFNFENASNANKLIVNKFLTNNIYPFSIIIDKQGRVNKIIIGGSFDKHETFQQFIPSIDTCLVKTD